jgi:hypothetical protein
VRMTSAAQRSGQRVPLNLAFHSILARLIWLASIGKYTSASTLMRGLVGE